MRAGRVFWFFGLSGSGKTTLTTALADTLREKGHVVLRLDGDELRSGLCKGLGFSDAARTENIRRAAEVARLAAGQGQVVLMAFITPREDLRQLVREIVGEGRVDFIWVDAPLDVCRQRDPKGLYRKSAAGDLPLFTGVDSAFESPQAAGLHLRTAAGGVESSLRELAGYCERRLGEDSR